MYVPLLITNLKFEGDWKRHQFIKYVYAIVNDHRCEHLSRKQAQRKSKSRIYRLVMCSNFEREEEKSNTNLKFDGLKTCSLHECGLGSR